MAERRPGDALDGYLRRLGLAERPAPTYSTLLDLHHRHLDRLPYDNLATMLGRPDPTDAATTMARVATGGNAGYCFHHNGLLEAALRALGFEVARRGASVVDAAGVVGPVDHHVVIVSGLPTPANRGGRWWPDVGFGDGFRDPLPLLEGTYVQGGFTYRVTGGDDDRWTFHHDPRGSFPASTAPRDPLTDEAIAPIHRLLTTPPEGRYTRTLVVERRTAAGVEALRCLTLERVGGAGGGTVEETVLEGYDDWRSALLALGLSLAGAGEDELRALHARMAGVHAEWVLSRELARG